MHTAPADTVHLMGTVAVPGLQEKGSIGFPSNLIEAPEPPHELIAVVEDAVGVDRQNLSQLLDGGVVGYVALVGGSSGSLSASIFS